MIINAQDIKIKQSPAGVFGMNVSVNENDPNMQTPTDMKAVNIDTDTLSQDDKKIVTDFIALVKSKMPK